jgi:hypothetical protein
LGAGDVRQRKSQRQCDGQRVSERTCTIGKHLSIIADFVVSGKHGVAPNVERIPGDGIFND